jgi:hypothetical protein
VGRYVGLFGQHHVATNVNITLSEDYLRLRQALTLALRPFPEARRAVAEALHRIEGEASKRILNPHYDAQRSPPGAVIEQAPPAPTPQQPSDDRVGPVSTP